MARFAFRLPDIGEGIAEAEIVAWHVKLGERVEEDAQLADMMTDKATVEMESPVSGIVVELAGDVGDIIAIGATLVVIETDADDDSGAEAEPPTDDPVPDVAAQTLNDAGASTIAQTMATVVEQFGVTADALAQPMPPAPATPSALETKRVLTTPAVRDRARGLNVDLAQVKPSADGRIRHADLDAFLRYNAAAGYAVGAAKRPDEAIKVIGMRRRIAENMAASKRAIPHFTYVEEIEVTKLEEMRADLNTHRGDRPKLTMLPLLILAICRTIPGFPMINARYDDEAGVVTRHGAVHLGMATQTDAGLMVPVIRDAQSKNIWQLAEEIKVLSESARAGKASSEQLSGSTLTITSLGPLGGIATTPVINRPEVAIIGPNKIIERPVFEGKEIRKAKLMNLSISCDHRVVDGWDAASFVQALKALIETPVLLFAD
jgi:2-oxoisovalerate dehydrogenase E2 component (dihydrolipoyl transacylase)